jgi:hypothetical protein
MGLTMSLNSDRTINLLNFFTANYLPRSKFVALGAAHTAVLALFRTLNNDLLLTLELTVVKSLEHE